MKYIPYQKVQEIEFGASKNEVIHTLGNPDYTSVNRKNLKELNYEYGVFRLDKTNKVVEVTLNLEQLILSGKKVSFKNLKNYIFKNDKESFETVGFYVSPKYGIAFDPHYKFWVTMFCKNELKKWQNINKEQGNT